MNIALNNYTKKHCLLSEKYHPHLLCDQYCDWSSLNLIENNL